MAYSTTSSSPVHVIPHVITSVIEHPAILEYLTYLSDVEKVHHFKLNELILKCYVVTFQKIEVTYLPVDNQGFVSPEVVSNSIQYNTALVTIMHSNNEVGTIQPIRQIGEVVASYNASLRMTGAAHKVLFHSDGAQSLGKVLIDVQQENIDLLTIVGHKFGAPKGDNYIMFCTAEIMANVNKMLLGQGIGALYVKDGINVTPLLHGGGQEGGRRAGTENVLLVAAIGNSSFLLPFWNIGYCLMMIYLKSQLYLAYLWVIR